MLISMQLLYYMLLFVFHDIILNLMYKYLINQNIMNFLIYPNSYNND
jgi:hypothetical protein